MTNATRNALASAFIPMIPVIMSIVKFISQMAIAFTELNPETPEVDHASALAALAVLGPLMSLLGSTMQLVGILRIGVQVAHGSPRSSWRSPSPRSSSASARSFWRSRRWRLKASQGSSSRMCWPPWSRAWAGRVGVILKTAGTAITALARTDLVLRRVHDGVAGRHAGGDRPGRLDHRRGRRGHRPGSPPHPQ